MKVSRIVEILEGELLVGEDKLDEEIKGGFASDMMSDVLAFVSDQAMLVTGLINPQVCRTCEMMDINCIVFVRGKTPNEMVLDIARQKGMIIIATKCKMYTACGRLYGQGLRLVD